MARIRDRTTPASGVQPNISAAPARSATATPPRPADSAPTCVLPLVVQPANPHSAQAERDEQDAGRALGERQVFEQQLARRAGAGAERHEHERKAGQERQQVAEAAMAEEAGESRQERRDPGETSEQNPAPKAASSVGVSSITSL